MCRLQLVDILTAAGVLHLQQVWLQLLLPASIVGLASTKA